MVVMATVAQYIQVRIYGNATQQYKHCFMYMFAYSQAIAENEFKDQCFGRIANTSVW